MISYFVENFLQSLYQQGQFKWVIKLGTRYVGWKKIGPDSFNISFFDLQILTWICCAQSITGQIPDSLKTAELGLACARRTDWPSKVVSFGEMVSNKKLILGYILEAFEMNTNVLTIAENTYSNALKNGDELNANLMKKQFSPMYHNRSWIYEMAQQFDKAEEAARIALNWSTEDFGEDAVHNTHNKMLLARILNHLGKLDEAEELIDKVVNLREKELDQNDIHVFSGWLFKGVVLVLKKDLDEAERYLSRSYEGAVEFDKKQGYPEFGYLKQWLGRLRLEQGKLLEAEKLLLESIEDFHSVYSVEHPTTLFVLEDIVRLYEEKGDGDKAIEYNSKIETIKSKLPDLQ